jgi:hypothetical protein
MVPGVHLPTSVLHGVRLWPAIRKLPVEISDDDLHWITDICEVAFRECRIGTVDIESGDASDAAHVFRLINKAGQPVSDQDIERAFGIQAVVSRAVDPEVFLACARRHGEDTSEPDHEIGDLIAILRASVDVLTVEQKKALPDTPIMRHLAGPERRPLEVIDIEDMIRTVIPMLSPTQIARFMSDQSVLAVLESVVIGDMDIDADTPWWTLYSNVVAMVSGESDSLPSP